MAGSEAIAGLAWVVLETNESFDDYHAYVGRLLDLRRPKADVVLTAYGTIVHPKSDLPDRPVIARSDHHDIVTFEILPDDALRRLGGCEFYAVGLATSERVHRLQRDVEALLAQSTDEEFGADVVANLRRMRADLRRLSEHRSGTGSAQDGEPDTVDDSMLKLNERVAALERALETSTLSGAEALLDELEDRVALLSDSKLDQIAAKSRLALVQMQLLSQETASNIHRAAFDELRDAVARWDDVVDAIPHVIKRLVAVKHLHEHGADVMRRVAALEATVQVTGDQLGQCAAAVANIERTLADNLKVMEANCAALSQRLDRLERSR